MKVVLLSITPTAEKLIERAGRTAYLSTRKQRQGTEKKFIRMLVKSGHHSVLEHANATFRIKGISRASSHQFVRHRFCSFTQKSQRYVAEHNFEYIEPASIQDNKKAHSLFKDFMNRAKNTYVELQKLNIKKEDARFVLPNAVETELVVTANFREWRHIIETRGSLKAQWEIRKLAITILKILIKHAPTVFSDYVIDKKSDVIRKVKSEPH
ncbi:MAG: FAD-dependent thymidylate synthase [Planctomycetota bacterium]